MDRPRPPAELLETFDAEGALNVTRFVPAHDLVSWMTETFIAEGASLENPEHAHLRQASIGALWTSVQNARHGRAIVGQCELGKPGGSIGKWQRARAEQQVIEWFGQVPDFILTFDAGYAAQADDGAWCALVEHELFHCGQAQDEFGGPKFLKSGLPAFSIRGHDVEEFIGVVRRYGAASCGVAAMIEAASQAPEIAQGRVAIACGNCAG